MRVGSLFSGYGGLDMACEAAFGAETAWVSDINPGACKILAHRYPDIPNIGDITKVDWNAVEPVDVLAGGFPCQDVSHAGKRAGLRPDTRSGLWSQMAYAVSILRPRYVVAENVRGLLSAAAHSSLEPCPWCVGGSGDGEPDLRALGCVLGDLAELGYNAQWMGLRAADVGAPHGRFRVFVVATDTQVSIGRSRQLDVTSIRSQGNRKSGGCSAVQDADLAARSERWQSAPGQEEVGRSRTHAGGRGGAPAAYAVEEPILACTNCSITLGEGIIAAWCPSGIHAYCDLCDGRGRPYNWDPCTNPAAADASSERHGRREDSRALGLVDGGAEGEARERERTWTVASDRGVEVAADTDSAGRGQLGRIERVERDTHGRSGADVAWGNYEPAIRRWERITGRVAPSPTETSARDAQRLSPGFVEWMMGLPAGWVTEVPDLGRNAQLKALGNGVVPQQAYAALTSMLATEVAA